MKTKKQFILVLTCIFCLSTVTVFAQNHKRFYIGGSFGLTDVTIIDQFTRYWIGRLVEKETFEDEFNGQVAGFFLGYRLLNTPRVFINVQAHGGFFLQEFLVETSSSTLRRKLFCSRGIDIQPGYNITKNLFFNVNFSIDRGRFQYSKEETSTTYDVDVPVLGYGFGMGIGYHVLPSFTVRVQYQFNQFETTEISTTLVALGRKIDVVELLPRIDIIMLTVQYNFGTKK